MKLLFDQNLSSRLVNRLMDLYPESSHVQWLGLGSSADILVWDYARNKDYTIVTKDADFGEMSVVQGYPPKVIWIRRGNCSTQDIEAMLRQYHSEILSLISEQTIGILTLF